ncbi:MAG: hypothetical protein NVS3B18_06720 [Candidatus Dormibacteria bacterium]
MHDTRLAFLVAADTARRALGLAEVADRWDEGSALPRMTIGALATHLARAITTVELYLATSLRQADQEPMSAAAYYAAMSGSLADLDSVINAGVRARAEEGAKAGRAAALEACDKVLAALRVHLPEEPDDRLIEVYGNQVLRLDEYLITRIVELTIHTDDLCVSLGRETPALPGLDATVRVLVEVAGLRHGRLAVLRALARRERDSEDALRVL